MKSNCLSQCDIYIAADGNDKQEGSRDKPFATLHRGLEYARRAKGGLRKRLLVGTGRYYDVNLSLDARDSGLLIEALPGAKVLLCGGRPITGWEKDNGKFWSAPLPWLLKGPWDFRALVVNNRMAKRARYPADGHLFHLTEFNVRWLSTTAGGWERPPTDADLTIMKYDPKDLPNRLEPTNAEISVYHSWDESLVGVAAMDAEKITFSNPAGHPPGAFGIKKYVVWNTREGMTEPGQWFLDRAHNRVVYWPLDSENIASLDVLAPTRETIVRCAGTKEAPIRDIVIRGINFALTNTPLVAGGFGAGKFPGALALDCADACRIEKCSFSGIAGQALKAIASNNLVVQDCSLREIGACGIALVNSNDSLLCRNEIKDAGKIYPSGIAVSISGHDNVIRANRIENTPYTAIACSGDRHLIEENTISKCMRELDDGAAIYITFCKKVVVRHNLVVGPECKQKQSAYYIDEQGADCLLEKNIAFHSAFPSHNHMARGCILRNNVFHSDGKMKLTFPKCSGFTMEKNILYAEGAISFTNTGLGIITAMPNNIFFSKSGMLETGAGGVMGRFVPRDGTVTTAPLFQCPERGDFTFKTKSPAKKLGIEPLNLKE